MKRQIFMALLIGSTLLILPNSCRYTCDCDRNMGCKILKVKLNSNGNVLITKTFCSQTNYSTDLILQDSVNNFINKHQSDSTTLTSKDSIYKYESVNNVKGSETDNYTKNGFMCVCPK